MESSGGAGSSSTDGYRGSPVTNSGSNNNNNNSRRYFSPSSIFQAPISALLEYSGLLGNNTRSNHETETLINNTGGFRAEDSMVAAPNSNGEVAIRIIGAGERENEREGSEGLVVGQDSDVSLQQPAVSVEDNRSGGGEGVSSQSGSGDGDLAGDRQAGTNGRDSSTNQRYDIQQAARWIEQVLPFSLLLLVVFIRQHLQGVTGFFVTIWIAAVMFKSNDILRKHTALKEERKISVLIGYSVLFTLHVVGIYWWYHNDDLLYPLVMLPPKSIPPFWHAIFQSYNISFSSFRYPGSTGRNGGQVFSVDVLQEQPRPKLSEAGVDPLLQKYVSILLGFGQMLTLVEYLILLYRALLPAPVWYRFFLNKEYGSLFSSLMTGLYLTFKLTSVVEKVQSFCTALRALSRKEVHYGSYATLEQVSTAGDLCAICQEKMHAPILLRCKHIFCEDCVSEWFERERTCPLCRALVKPADLRSYGDGSTSLFFQIF
ncbi:hypothetical protein ACFE04_000161 [Oxalis oulophora]